jgi:hypothetical protein
MIGTLEINGAKQCDNKTTLWTNNAMFLLTRKACTLRVVRAKHSNSARVCRKTGGHQSITVPHLVFAGSWGGDASLFALQCNVLLSETALKAVNC